MSCECGWEIDAPARSPWFLKIRMYLNRLSRIRSSYRCLYAVELLVPAAMDLRLDLQGRVLVRDTPNPPPRTVRDSVLSIGEDFGRGHVFVAVAERALLRVRRRSPAAERPGPLGPRRREDNPGIRHVVFPQFWHEVPGRILEHDRLLFQGCP